MGDAEDTFTKQEIQAGYVTSGRDVLARQQQIMAQLQNAVGGSGRKKVGGGGPSGTGKASTNPVFPPPTYDEPIRVKSTAQRIRSATTPAMPVVPSAAAIVAGSHNPTPVAPAPHTTLTPLKRSGSAVAKPIGLVGSSSDLTPAESMALQKEREEQLAAQQKEMSRRQSENGAGKLSSSPSSSVGSGASKGELKQNGATVEDAIGALGSIGGSSIPMGSALFGGGLGSSNSFALNSLEFGSIGHATGSGALGGQPIGQIPSDEIKSGVIGGISLAPSNNPFSLDSLLAATPASSGGDKWGASAGNGGQNGLFANSSSFGMSSGGIWGSDESSAAPKRSNPAPIGPSNRSNGVGSDIGGTSLFGTNSNPFGSGSGSSALASILGIELPTGSGSLRESGLFPGHSNASHPAVGSLNNSNVVGAIGAKTNNMLPIGAPSCSQGVTIGSYASGGNNSDMALLQSLLPGVNITSGATPQQVGSLNQASQLGGDKWNGGLSHQQYNNDEQQRSGNIW